MHQHVHGCIHLCSDTLHIHTHTHAYIHTHTYTHARTCACTHTDRIGWGFKSDFEGRAGNVNTHGEKDTYLCRHGACRGGGREVSSAAPTKPQIGGPQKYSACVSVQEYGISARGGIHVGVSAQSGSSQRKALIGGVASAPSCCILNCAGDKRNGQFFFTACADWSFHKERGPATQNRERDCSYTCARADARACTRPGVSRSCIGLQTRRVPQGLHIQVPQVREAATKFLHDTASVALRCRVLEFPPAESRAS
jgi:hypothetical protein